MSRRCLLLVTLLFGSFATAKTPHKGTKSPTTSCPQCGTERWPVKTLSDTGASAVQFTPVQKTVSELIAQSPPSVNPGDSRGNSVEKQVFKVRGRLMGFKQEFDPTLPPGKQGDHDFHIVIADPADLTKTMVVEIPDPKCSGACTCAKRADIAAVRQTFLSAFPHNPPEARFQTVDGNVDVTVTGVGFYDFFHSQTGVARTCVELHPVIQMTFVSTPPFKATLGTPQSLVAKAKPFYTCIPE